MSRLMDALSGRRSIRRFSERPVSRELLEELLESVRYAPSAGGRQQYRFIVVSRPETIREMGQTVTAEIERIENGLRTDLKDDLGSYTRNFVHFATAPVVIAATFRHGLDLIGLASDDDERDGRDGMRPLMDSLSSVAAAIQNLLLAIHDAGLGACWMTGPLVAAQPLEELLGISAGWELAAIIPVGYPDGSPEVPRRRPLSTLVRFEE